MSFSNVKRKCRDYSVTLIIYDCDLKVQKGEECYAVSDATKVISRNILKWFAEVCCYCHELGTLQ
jgi:hypothetical protein